MPRLTISAFADEISADLEEQLQTLVAEGVRYLAVRDVRPGVKVTEVSDAELLRLRREIHRRGLKVSSIGSAIGKVKIGEPFEPHLERFRRALIVARVLDAPYVRLFSFYGDDMKPPLGARAEVTARMKAFVADAAGTGVVLLHENDSDLFGEQPAQCRDLLDAVGSPVLRAAFDFANFVQRGARPFDDALPLLAHQIEYLHIKDARRGSGEVVPFGEGDGQVRQVLRALFARGFSGFATLEPHLAAGGRHGGFSGPEKFRLALRSLRAVLDEIGYLYE
jgi:sugar phosphate isomerase/epimerase